MIHSIVYDRSDDPSLRLGYFYAHIPALGLTTHGEGIEGAKAAALDLLKLWAAEKTANGESLPVEHEKTNCGLPSSQMERIEFELFP